MGEALVCESEQLTRPSHLTRPRAAGAAAPPPGRGRPSVEPLLSADAAPAAAVDPGEEGDGGAGTDGLEHRVPPLLGDEAEGCWVGLGRGADHLPVPAEGLVGVAQRQPRARNGNQDHLVAPPLKRVKPAAATHGE